MRHIAKLFPRGRRRGAAATRRLVEAYVAVFSGNGGKEAAELVLADLAEQTGFFTVSTPLESAEAVRFAEGKRAVFGRILRLSRPTVADVERLIEASRIEATTSQEEGSI